MFGIGKQISFFTTQPGVTGMVFETENLCSENRTSQTKNQSVWGKIYFWLRWVV